MHLKLCLNFCKKRNKNFFTSLAIWIEFQLRVSWYSCIGHRLFYFASLTQSNHTRESFTCLMKNSSKEEEQSILVQLTCTSDMWLQKLLLSHKWFLSHSAFTLDVPEGIWINIMRMFMKHLIIILEIALLNNILGFITELHEGASLIECIFRILFCLHSLSCMSAIF